MQPSVVADVTQAFKQRGLKKSKYYSVSKNKGSLFHSLDSLEPSGSPFVRISQGIEKSFAEEETRLALKGGLTGRVQFLLWLLTFSQPAFMADPDFINSDRRKGHRHL